MATSTLTFLDMAAITEMIEQHKHDLYSVTIFPSYPIPLEQTPVFEWARGGEVPIYAKTQTVNMGMIDVRVVLDDWRERLRRPHPPDAACQICGDTQKIEVVVGERLQDGRPLYRRTRLRPCFACL